MIWFKKSPLNRPTPLLFSTVLKILRLFRIGFWYWPHKSPKWNSISYQICFMQCCIQPIIGTVYLTLAIKNGPNFTKNFQINQKIRPRFIEIQINRRRKTKLIKKLSLIHKKKSKSIKKCITIIKKSKVIKNIPKKSKSIKTYRINL